LLSISCGKTDPEPRRGEGSLPINANFFFLLNLFISSSRLRAIL